MTPRRHANQSQTNEEITRLVQSLRATLMGEDGHEASTDVTTHIANEVYAQDMMAVLITHLPVLEFEVGHIPCDAF
jgi:calcium binding protein 39